MIVRDFDEYMAMEALQLSRTHEGEVPVLSLVTVEVPTPGPGELLVKIKASAIHPSDLMNARGGFPYTVFPRIPGRDFAGTVVAGPRSGEEVFGTSGYTHAFTTNGFHAEYCVVSEDAVTLKPKNVTFAQAACLGVPLTTASLALQRAAVEPSDCVLVIGASGSVGSYVVQLAQSMGCRVLRAARQSPTDVCIAEDEEFSALTSLTQGRGVDVVIDTVGMPALMKAAAENLAHGGRMAVISARYGAELAIDLKDFYRNEKSLVGCNTLSHSAPKLAKELAAMSQALEKGDITPEDEKVWTKFSLGQAAEAYRKSEEGSGKYVLVMEEHCKV